MAARNRPWQPLPVAMRRRLLHQRLVAVCNAALVIVGLQLLLLGCAMELNIVSLRELAPRANYSPGIGSCGGGSAGDGVTPAAAGIPTRTQTC